MDEGYVRWIGSKPPFDIGGDEEGFVEGEVGVSGVTIIDDLVEEGFRVVFVLADIPDHEG